MSGKIGVIGKNYRVLKATRGMEQTCSQHTTSSARLEIYLLSNIPSRDMRSFSEKHCTSVSRSGSLGDKRNIVRTEGGQHLPLESRLKLDDDRQNSLR